MVLPGGLAGGSAVIGVLGAVTAMLITPIWGVALVLTALCAGVSVRRPALGVHVLFVCGVLLVDISALSIYRYFLLSDLLFLSAFSLQTWIDRRTEVYYPRLLTWLFVVYLTAHFIAFGRSADMSSASTWLHSLFVMLAYTPILTTLLVRRPELTRSLFVALMVSGGLQASSPLSPTAWTGETGCESQGRSAVCTCGYMRPPQLRRRASFLRVAEPHGSAHCWYSCLSPWQKRS